MGLQTDGGASNTAGSDLRGQQLSVACGSCTFCLDVLAGVDPKTMPPRRALQCHRDRIQ